VRANGEQRLAKGDIAAAADGQTIGGGGDVAVDGEIADRVNPGVRSAAVDLTA